MKTSHHILTKQTCRHQPHIKQNVKIINTIHKYGCFNNVYTCTNAGKLFEARLGRGQGREGEQNGLAVRIFSLVQ